MNALPYPAPAALPKRVAESHKGDFGRVLLVGGGRGMAGSISLSTMAALRSGSGLVSTAVPSAILSTVAGFEPSAMTISLPDDEAGQIGPDATDTLLPILEKMDAVGCGPGMGTGAGARDVVLAVADRRAMPRVFDADALNILAKTDRWRERVAGAVLTPHPGEFSRLLAASPDGRSAQEQAAAELARETSAVVVLKGHQTFVSDGKRSYRNLTGNPGMATGGTGDVLTGIITSLAGQQMAPFEAACLGVFAHGLAGDIGAEKLGEVGMIASDLVSNLPEAWRRIEAE